MILLILCWVFLLPLFYIIGLFLLEITTDKISGIAQQKMHTAHEYIIAIWLGIVSISIILLAISVFFKLSLFVFFSIAIVLASIALSSSTARSSAIKLFRNFSFIRIMNLMVILVFTAFISTVKVKVYDTGSISYSAS